MTCSKERPGEEAGIAALTAFIAGGPKAGMIAGMNIIRNLEDGHVLQHCAETLLRLTAGFVDVDNPAEDLAVIQRVALERQAAWEGLHD